MNNVNCNSEKYSHELGYWHGQFVRSGNKFGNAHFEKIMLGIAGEPDDSFLEDKIVVDFGCGPRGSLVWTKKPRIKVGVDVLVGAYLENFGPTMMTHGMVYLQSTEQIVPLPTGFADVVFTMNAMDHTVSFPTMAEEVLRILKPGGLFCGSFNLNEPPTACEPQTLTEEFVHRHILNHLKVKFYRTCTRNPDIKDVYKFIFEEHRYVPSDTPGFLWVSGTKREDTSAQCAT